MCYWLTSLERNREIQLNMWSFGVYINLVREKQQARKPNFTLRSCMS
jgi:hypothetical protein